MEKAESPGEDGPVPFRGLEGRRQPELERVHRLHIVVAVDQYGRRALRALALAVDDAVPRGGDDLAADAHALQLGEQPARGALHVFLAIRIAADAGNLQEIQPLFPLPGGARPNRLDHFLHVKTSLSVGRRPM